MHGCGGMASSGTLQAASSLRVYPLTASMTGCAMIVTDSLGAGIHDHVCHLALDQSDTIKST